MRRRLFTLCSALSLLLFVAVCALWVRSYWRQDELWWAGRNPVAQIGLWDVEGHTLTSAWG